MSTTPKENHGNSIVVFDSIAQNTSIGWQEKGLWSLLFGLSFTDGFCFATNDYLAIRMGTTPNAIKTMLSSLKSKGLIVIKDENKKRRTRNIYLPNLEKFSQYTKKTLDALTPEQHEESLHVSVEEPPFVDKYAKFASPKKEPKTTNIVNIGQVVLSPRMREDAIKRGLSEEDTGLVFEHFLDNMKAKGSSYKDYEAAFRNWMDSKYFGIPQKKIFKASATSLSSSSSSKVGERIGIENSLLADNAVFASEMRRRGIYPEFVLEGSKVLPPEFSWLGIMTISTLKKGVQKIWYDTRKFKQDTSCDDVITVEIIENKGN